MVTDNTTLLCDMQKYFMKNIFLLMFHLIASHTKSYLLTSDTEIIIKHNS